MQNGLLARIRRAWHEGLLSGKLAKLRKCRYLRIAGLGDQCSIDVLVTWALNGCISQSEPRTALPWRLRLSALRVVSSTIRLDSCRHQSGTACTQ
jgi:hypothetical protein